MVFENRVLRKIFILTGEEIRRWRKLHTEEHSFYSSPNIIGSSQEEWDGEGM
jgi:hypothetical protein